jgi:hypothetical protein
MAARPAQQTQNFAISVLQRRMDRLGVGVP